MISDLFGNPIEIKSESSKKQKRKLAKSHYRARIDSFYQSDIERLLETTSIYDMPLVKANTNIPQCTTTIPFDRIKTGSGESLVTSIHMITDLRLLLIILGITPSYLNHL